MEAVTGAKPFPKRFLCHEEPYSVEIEMNRKRKLRKFESGNTALPWPKYKTLNRFATSAQKAFLSENTGKENALEQITSNVTHDVSEIESEQGSNSFTNGGSDNKMSFVVNNNPEPYLQDLATFSDSPSCSTGEVNSAPHADLDDTTQTRNKSTEDQEEYLDPITDEFIEGNDNGFMESYNKDEVTDDMMLYSNDVAPFLRSSDGRQGTRKPTIDQEFEQYFAALMI